MLIRRILVPVDGTPDGSAILPHVRSLVERQAADLVLVRAIDWPLVEPYGAAADDPAAPVEQDLKRLRASLDGEPWRGIRTVARPGLAAEVIARVAQQEEATLIAMSTHARKGPARWILGSVTEQVIRAAVAPVLAVPLGRTPDEPLRRILVPHDGSWNGLCLLQPVVELAQLFDAEVTLLRFPPLPGRRPEEEDDVDLACLFRKRGVRLRTTNAVGPAGEAVLSFARSQKAGLVAMAVRRHPGVSSLTRAGLVCRVARHAGRPFLAVPDRLTALVRRLPTFEARAA
jgi:nucleotide-binding universal stress UspA family protein